MFFQLYDNVVFSNAKGLQCFCLFVNLSHLSEVKCGSDALNWYSKILCANSQTKKSKTSISDISDKVSFKNAVNYCSFFLAVQNKVNRKEVYAGSNIVIIKKRQLKQQ